MAAVRASAGKNFANSVFGSLSVCATGIRLVSSGFSALIAWFRELPRAANASPKPSRF